MHVTWRWSVWTAVPIFCGFIIVDLAFFGANLLKIAEGGWIPLLLGVLIMTMMTTWRSGVAAIHRAQHLRSEPLTEFNQQIEHHRVRSPRTAVFLTRFAHQVPSLIVEHVRQIGAVPKVMIALSVHFTDHPRVRNDERIEIEQLCANFWHVTVRYGFVEIPDVPATFSKAQEAGCGLSFDDAIYYAERGRPVRRSRSPRMHPWRRMVFAFLLRNAVHAVDLFKLPPRDFVEIGREIEI
jgi:KUP system potassium uptake protein